MSDSERLAEFDALMQAWHAGQVDVEQEQRLLQLLDDGDLRQRALDMHQIERLHALGDSEGFIADVQADIDGRREKFLNGVAQATSQPKRPRPSPVSRRHGRQTRRSHPQRRQAPILSVSLLIAAVAAGLIWMNLPSQASQTMPTTLQWQLVSGSVTANGKLLHDGTHPVAEALQLEAQGDAAIRIGDKLIGLSDGTRCTYDPTNRLALTQGRVEVDISGREDPPFVVQTAQTQVQVLGTVFSVETHNSGSLVRVTRGKVQLTAEAEQVLTAGEVAHVPSTGAALPGWLLQQRPRVVVLNDHLSNTILDEAAIAAHQRAAIDLVAIGTIHADGKSPHANFLMRDELFQSMRTWGWQIPKHLEGADGNFQADAPPGTLAEAIAAAARASTPEAPLIVLSGGGLSDIARAAHLLGPEAKRMAVITLGKEDGQASLRDDRAAAQLLTAVRTLVIPVGDHLDWSAAIGSGLETDLTTRFADHARSKGERGLRTRGYRCHDLPVLLALLDPLWVVHCERHATSDAWHLLHAGSGERATRAFAHLLATP